MGMCIDGKGVKAGNWLCFERKGYCDARRVAMIIGHSKSGWECHFKKHTYMIHNYAAHFSAQFSSTVGQVTPPSRMILSISSG